LGFAMVVLGGIGVWASRVFIQQKIKSVAVPSAWAPVGCDRDLRRASAGDGDRGSLLGITWRPWRLPPFPPQSSRWWA
jgi:hypothetical protein